MPLEDFIQEKLDYFSDKKPSYPQPKAQDTAALDQFFLKTLDYFYDYGFVEEREENDDDTEES